MRLGVVIGVSVALAVVASVPATAAPSGLRYFKTYPELQTNGFGAGLNAAAVQPDGKVVVAGSAFQANGVNTDWVVARIDPVTGALDSTFGQGGVVKLPVDLVAGGYDTAYAVAVGPGGRIVVAGDAQAPGGGWDMAVIALSATGARDTGFGPQGLRTVGFFTSSIDRARAVVVDASGTVTLGGLAGGSGPNASGFGLVRLNSTGQPVSGFGNAGKVVTPFGSASGGDEISDLLLLGDGKLIAVGTAERGSQDADLAFARYDTGGQASPTKVIAAAGVDDAADAELVGQQIVVGSDRRVNFSPTTLTQAFSLTTFDPIQGYGGADTFGSPSLYGGIAPNPGGGLLALGIGPFGGGLDDWQFALLGADGRPAGPVEHQPGTADKQELAGALVMVPGGLQRLARQGPSESLVVAVGSQSDIPAVAAVEPVQAVEATLERDPADPNGLVLTVSFVSGEVTSLALTLDAPAPPGGWAVGSVSPDANCDPLNLSATYGLTCSWASSPGSPIKVFFKTGSRYTANAANTLKLNGGAEGGGVTLQVTGPTETVTPPPPPPPATRPAVFVLDSVSEIEVAKRAAAAAYKANLEDAQNGGLFNTIGLTEQVKSTPQGEEILDVLKDATGGLGEVIEKTVKIVGKATATTFYVGAYVEFLLAKDPPRSDFTVIATLAKPKGARLKAQRALPARTAKALNALHANSAGVGAAATAFVISLERAQGAVAAQDSASESKQVAAAAGFATKWATLLNGRARLKRRLVAALKSTGSRFRLTARQVKGLPRLYRKALPGGLLNDLERFGLTTAQAKQARKTYRKEMARRPAKSLRFPVSLQSRNAARTDTKLATALRALAARLQVIAAATKG